MSTAEKSKNILVVLPNPMGDAILCTPALGRLRRCLPGARLTLLGSKVAVEVLAGNPGVDKFLICGKGVSEADTFWRQVRLLKRQEFDAAILLPNSFRTALLVRLAGIGQRIGYDRDGRGSLLTGRVQPIRLARRFAPISMLDYYGFLIDRAITILREPLKIDFLLTKTSIATTRHGLKPILQELLEVPLSGKPVNQIDSNRQLELFTSDQDKNEIDELFEGWELSAEKLLVIMVPGGAFGPSKFWQPERFAELADRLIEENNCEVIISAAPNEAEKRIAGQIVSSTSNKVHNLGETGVNLGGLKELIGRCGLMVGNDTGPCHIAAALGVPLVTLFGPTDPRWTATGYAKEIRLREDVPCGPCQEEICREERHLCLENISVNQVHAGAVELLSGGKAVELNNGQPERESAAGKTGIDAARYYSVFDEQFVPLPDGSGLIHKDYQELLCSNQLDSCEGVFAFTEGDRLDKPGLGKRERLRLELSDAAGKATVIYLKRFRREGAFNVLGRWLIRRSRASAAVFDFAATMQLAEKGIAVARPIAFGQEQGLLGEIRSFVMIEELPRADALERLLPQGKTAQQQYQMLRDKQLLIREIAQLVRRQHQANLFHRDLYLAHIFLSKDEADNERLNLIDLQRIFQPIFRRRRWQVKDLAQLNYSARQFFSRTDGIRFLRKYFQCSRLTDMQKKLARSVLNKTSRIARHDKKKQNREIRSLGVSPNS